MNEARLIEVLAHIKNHPESWDQGTWFTLTHRCFTPADPPVSLSGYMEVLPVAALPAHCGTGACLAGWTVQLTPEARVFLTVGETYADGSVQWDGGTLVNIEGGSTGLPIEAAAVELLEFDPSGTHGPDCTYGAEDYEECPGGDEPCERHEYCWDLFGVDNEWDDLIRIGAYHLGVSPEVLEERVNCAALDAQYAKASQ